MRKFRLFVFLVVLIVSFLAYANQKSVQEWKETLEKPERDKWQKPEKVIEIMNLRPGLTVADIGAGTGYFLPYLVDAIAPNGTLFLIDIDTKLLEHLRERAKKYKGLVKTYFIKASKENPYIPYESTDKALMVNTWHHIKKKDRSTYARFILEGLKKGGELYIVDFDKDSEIGPPKDRKVAAKEVLDTLQSAGFEAYIMENDPLEHQYIVIGRKK